MSMFRNFDSPKKFNDLKVHCAMILMVDDGEIIAPPGPRTSDKVTILYDICGEDAAVDHPGIAVTG